MPFNDYRIVGKSFDADRRLRTGEAVDTSNFRNIRGLEEGRYLRKPETEEDYQLINESIEKAEEVSAFCNALAAGGGITDIETIVNVSSDNIIPAKRGRPPKNGGDE